MEDINCSELKERISNQESLNIVDVREVRENLRGNLGGINIPMGTIPQKLNELNNLKNEELIVYCQTGVRSGMVKQYLQQQGFRKVRNLLGGIVEFYRTG